MTNDTKLSDRLANLSLAKRALLEKRLRGENTAVSPSSDTSIQPRPADAPLVLSYAQERLWFLQQLYPDSTAYNMHEAVIWRGALHHKALQQALNLIVACHPVLRTTFRAENGQPVLQVASEQSLVLPIVDLQSLPVAEQSSRIQELAMVEAKRPFNLQTDPLLRTTLLQLAPDHFVFLLTMHHIIGDEWSLEQFWRELRAGYQAAAAGQPITPPDNPIGYADYAHWQRTQQAHDKFKAELAYWQRQLAGNLPVLQLPFDRPRPATLSNEGAMRSQALPAELLSALRQLSQSNKTTLFMTLMAAFQVLLYRYSHQGDILTGTPIANRSHPETQRLLGLFLNTLVIRAQIDASGTFTELLAQTRQTMLDGFAHQEVPFEQVVQAVQPQRDPALTPLFQTMFVYQQEQPVLAGWPEATLSQLPVDGGVAKFDLTLFVTETADQLTAAIEFRRDLFDDATIDRMLSHFTVLLEGIVAAPDTAVSRLPLLSE